MLSPGHPLTQGRLSLLLAAAMFLLLPIASTALENASDEAAESAVHNAKSAFETLKKMEGEWTGTVRRDDGEPRDTTVTFRVSAGGHSVIETFAPGKPYEMFSVYHLDGDQLLMTHYCAIGNAPKMKFAPTDAAGKMVFEFNGGTNMDPEKDAHAHEGSMQLLGTDRYRSEAVGWANGEKSSVQYFDMRRAAPSQD